MTRLQKYLAQCGIGSRRACEILITAGRIRVNKKVVSQLGSTVDPAHDRIEVDGRVVHPEAPLVLAVNKPIGVLCTSRDPQGRPTIFDVLRGRPSRTGDPWPVERLYTVGRLDADSEGLLLLTNNGALAHRLTHPRHGVPRIYQVWVCGAPSAKDLHALQEGILHEGQRLRAERICVLWRRGKTTCCRITLGEGKKRQIRRMFASLGFAVVRLRRVAIGSLKLGSLATGDWRLLPPAEVRRLLRPS